MSKPSLPVDGTDPAPGDPFEPVAILELALHRLADACLLVDETDRILGANEAAKELIKPKGRMIGRRLETILADRRMSLLVSECLSTGREQSDAVTLRLPGEAWRDDRYLTAHAVCIPVNPQTRLVRLTLREDLEADQQARSVVPAPSKDILLQLRGPLSIVQGYLENLLDGMITDPVAMRKSLLTMRKSTVQIERVLESLKQ